MHRIELTEPSYVGCTLPSGTNPRLVTVRPDADLGDVLSKMAFNHVHHVFVTDLESRPIGEGRPRPLVFSVKAAAVAPH